MYICVFGLRSFILLAADLIIIIKALPSNYNLVRDDLFSMLPETGLSSENYDLLPQNVGILETGINDPPSEFVSLGLQESDTPSLGITEPSLEIFDSAPHVSDSYSLEDSADLFALAPTQMDTNQPLLNAFDQLGTDIDTIDTDYPLIDLGPTTETLDNFPPVDTLEPSDTSSEYPELVGLFAEDSPDESSSVLAHATPGLFEFGDTLPPEDGTFPNTMEPAEDSSLVDLVGPGEVNSLPNLEDATQDENLFDYVDRKETLLAGGKKTWLEKGTNVTPQCSGRKTPACCSTKPASHGMKTGCVSYLQMSGMFCPWKGRLCCSIVHESVGSGCEQAEDTPEEEREFAEFSEFGWFIPVLLRGLRAAPVIP